MGVINEPFAVRRRPVNWLAVFVPLGAAVLVSCLMYACNSWRVSADRAVERWAQKVGVE